MAAERSGVLAPFMNFAAIGKTNFQTKRSPAAFSRAKPVPGIKPGSNEK